MNDFKKLASLYESILNESPDHAVYIDPRTGKRLEMSSVTKEGDYPFMLCSYSKYYFLLVGEEGDMHTDAEGRLENKIYNRENVFGSVNIYPTSVAKAIDERLKGTDSIMDIKNDIVFDDILLGRWWDRRNIGKSFFSLWRGNSALFKKWIVPQMTGEGVFNNGKTEVFVQPEDYASNKWQSLAEFIGSSVQPVSVASKNDVAIKTLQRQLHLATPEDKVRIRKYIQVLQNS
jgi:hypothetical protein